ncbi:MAG: DUF1611 domain-containing protein [Planctomycetes bacterium]|nr:DUF1611 domain-containing protein [Planctomycetota bacterium]
MSEIRDAVHTPSERISLQVRPRRNLALLTEGLEIFHNKTAMGMLRYCPEDAACVIDASNEGKNLQELIGMGGGIPVVSSVEESKQYTPEYLVIGVSTPGGYLPDSIRSHVYKAIRARIGVISGLHEELNTDPNIASLACRHAVDLIDLRKIPEEEVFIASGRAQETGALRVLTVGTDCNLGKMTTSIQLEMFMRNQQSIRARFVATGQNGILIKGRGVCLDRCISDFAAGAIERLVLREDEDNMSVLIIEGQGSLLSPPFSGVCLSLLHGSMPDAMILCHRVGRKMHRNSETLIPPLEEYVELYNIMMKPLYKNSKVVAISVNTQGMSDAEAHKEMQEITQRTGLPAADVVRQGHRGCEILSNAVLAYANNSLGRSIAPDHKWSRSETVDDFDNTIVGHPGLSEA